MKLVIPILALATVAAAAPPQLSTAEKQAIQSLEKAKQDAQSQFTNAMQGEQTIAKEFTAAHPGYSINLTTFVVEPIKPEPKK